METTALFDAELLRRYDRHGPRYTSYPTAPQFHAGFGEPDLREAIDASNGDPIPRPLSIYVHVPFCESPCFYCGCNRVITRDTERGRRYLAPLSKEIERVGPLFDRDRDTVQVHFGGGTPNFLAPVNLEAIVAKLRRHFTFADDRRRDQSIELDPRFVSTADIAELAALGFNRASLGVQDFDPDVQRAVNRVQSVDATRATLEACRTYGFQSVNVDLIYGLPRQRPETFARTLDTVVEMRPDRLAVFSYAHLPALFRPQRQVTESELPSPDTKLELLRLAIERLTDAGYVYIGMDHFALPDDALSQAQARGGLHRTFMGYTTHADSDLVGFGVSAISQIGDSFSQNPRDIETWQAALDAGRLPVFRGLRLSEDDRLRADLIQHLMCHGDVPVDTLEHRYGIDFRQYFARSLESLAPLAQDGLVEIERHRIAVTARGRLLLRNVAMCFDRYLEAADGGGRTAFSRAI